MDAVQRVQEIIKKIGRTPDKLIEILIEIQSSSDKHYVTEEELQIVSNYLEIPLSKAYGVATFYSMLSTKKRGKFVIQICNSAPCYLKNSKNIAETFEAILGIEVGEVTKDGLFSLEYTSCIGACDIAPAVKINDDIYGELNAEKIEKIINDLRKEEM
ncbi:NAD(P)H-dependent oxidoreductase subunit E [Brassicibacter mesophilus]|uniref:NADH-quinone oxidoreductase subunit NuoE family protein n=1 Tax=Brassicibacter mesophilus TaxID=745119 RepID=UPI003D24D8B7